MKQKKRQGNTYVDDDEYVGGGQDLYKLIIIHVVKIQINLNRG